jgi:hypothetical protein
MNVVKYIRMHVCMYNKLILASVNSIFGSDMNIKIFLKWGMFKTYDSNIHGNYRSHQRGKPNGKC